MQFDLNLLVVFDAIMTELNLTAAAKRIGKTQSAVSHSLKRLRKLTKDPLFKRTGRGVKPTPRAMELEREVRPAIKTLQAALQGRSEFDPDSEKRTFLIDIPAGFDWIVAPQLAKRLQTLPGVTLSIQNTRAANIVDEPRYRETWLALDYMPLHAQGYHSETLFEDEIVLVARPGHPSFSNGLRMDTLGQLGQVGIGWSVGKQPVNHPVDERLLAAGFPRIVKLWVPTLATMYNVVARSDLIAYAGSRVATQYSRSHDIVLHPLPAGVRTMPLIMVWHESFDRDAGHRWLRETVRDICREMCGG